MDARWISLFQKAAIPSSLFKCFADSVLSHPPPLPICVCIPQQSQSEFPHYLYQNVCLCVPVGWFTSEPNSKA